MISLNHFVFKLIICRCMESLYCQNRTADKTELKTKQRKARRQPMPKLLVSILILIAVAVIGGGIYIAVWDVPPPARTVEKVLPDDMLGK